MRIFINDSGDLCLAFRRHHWEDDTIIVLPDEKAARRRINRAFRAVAPENVLQKSLRRLRALEHGGDYLPGGYEYASVLEECISEVVNSRF